MKKPASKSRKKIVVVGLIILAILVGGGIIAKHQFMDKRTVNAATDSSAKTTSTVTSAQSNFTSNDTSKDPSNTRPNNTGSITDTNGATQTTTDTTNGTASANGAITVYSPVKDALLTNGATISGTSTLSKVSYRIVDTEVGMISSGILNVVDGKFSGTIQFRTNAATGQLDFFSTQSDGNEIDNISIPVRFK